jgi:hypothetical protein
MTDATTLLIATLRAQVAHLEGRVKLQSEIITTWGPLLEKYEEMEEDLAAARNANAEERARGFDDGVYALAKEYDIKAGFVDVKMEMVPSAALSPRSERREGEPCAKCGGTGERRHCGDSTCPYCPDEPCPACAPAAPKEEAK